VSKCRLRGSQEIKVAKDGRGIRLLHNAAAGASGIFSLDSAVGFHHNRATTRWIDAMPALPGFHNHGPFSSLHKYGWMSAKAIAGWARDERRATLIISKQKSKKIFNVYRIYLISTKRMTARLRESGKGGFSPPLRPSTFCLSGGAEGRRSYGRTRSGGCEGGGRLLKFDVCWDAAVCAVSAGGFFSVWDGVRKTNDRRPVLSA
jgi:hypothetical protein